MCPIARTAIGSSTTNESRALAESTPHHAVAATARWHGALSDSTEISVAAGGGRDSIESTNLGDHAFFRGNVAAELRQRLASPRL